MKNKTKIDLNKHKLNKKDKEKLSFILKFIKEKKVLNWSQLEIYCVLNEVEINDSIFINLLDYLPIREVYLFIKDSLNKCEECATFFECYETIEKILVMEDLPVQDKEDGSFFPKTFRFSCVNFLDNFEIKHPYIFLKYFLDTEHKVRLGIKYGYRRLLKKVIERTELRATKNEQYKELLPKLKQVYEDVSNDDMYLN